MVTAPVLASEEIRQAWAGTQTRGEQYVGFDLWLDALEETVKQEPPSLEALSRAVFVKRQELTGMVTEVLVKRRHGQALDQRRPSLSPVG